MYYFLPGASPTTRQPHSTPFGKRCGGDICSPLSLFPRMQHSFSSPKMQDTLLPKAAIRVSCFSFMLHFLITWQMSIFDAGLS
jgi:hypothetical protein